MESQHEILRRNMGSLHHMDTIGLYFLAFMLYSSRSVMCVGQSYINEIQFVSQDELFFTTLSIGKTFAVRGWSTFLIVMYLVTLSLGAVCYYKEADDERNNLQIDFFAFLILATISFFTVSL